MPKGTGNKRILEAHRGLEGSIKMSRDHRSWSNEDLRAWMIGADFPDLCELLCYAKIHREIRLKIRVAKNMFA